jgi:hypothetical protein
VNKARSSKQNPTYEEEDPLKSLTLVIAPHLEGELALLVVMRHQVEEDGSCFEDPESVIAVVHEGWYASIGINLIYVRESLL